MSLYMGYELEYGVTGVSKTYCIDLIRESKVNNLNLHTSWFSF